MTEARTRERWNHTATLMALLANCHRDARTRAFTPADFHPLVSTHQSPLPTTELSILKTVFVDRRMPEMP